LSFTDVPGWDTHSWDSLPFDPFFIDEEGNVVLHPDNLDVIVESWFDETTGSTITDLDNPEDIIVDGGAFVDAYSSHAPEELIPGRIFDTLDFQVYQLLSDSSMIGFRIMNDMNENIEYRRISSAEETTLSQDLNQGDGTIYVTDASVLVAPDIATLQPGVIVINGEKIIYWERNTISNTLNHILRNRDGTGSPTTHASGTYVTDISASTQEIVDGDPNVWYNQGGGTATDGTGLEGSTKPQALFIKQRNAVVP